MQARIEQSSVHSLSYTVSYCMYDYAVLYLLYMAIIHCPIYINHVHRLACDDTLPYWALLLHLLDYVSVSYITAVLHQLLVITCTLWGCTACHDTATCDSLCRIGTSSIHDRLMIDYSPYCSMLYRLCPPIHRHPCTAPRVVTLM